MSEDSNRLDVTKIQCCSCCGLAQTLPEVPPEMTPACGRCGSALRLKKGTGSNHFSFAFALAALLIYPLAVGLPMIRVEKFGHSNESSILEGIVTLLASGQLVVGVVVLLCSVILPLGKLIALILLCSGGIRRRAHRAWTYHLVEWTGRWGMLDVLLVALLVAALKLGDLVDVSAGPAALAFTTCVLASLTAGACFDPHLLWSATEEGTPS